MNNSIAEQKTAVITGATFGIGKATALALGKLGINLILIGRNERAGIRIAERINARPDAGQAAFLKADISSQKQIHYLADAINSSHKQVDILINNAGARFDEYGKSQDGLERTFATNHIGHFLLTCLLLEKLLNAPAARVITISSSAHSYSNPGSSWQLQRNNYNRSIAYGNSKLANIIFSHELARRLKKTHITSNSMHPGGVASRFASNNGLWSWIRHIAYHTIKREIVFAAKAAETIVYLAVSPDVAGITGKYFYRQEEVQSAPISYDPNVAHDLWKLSIELTSLNEDIGKVWSILNP